MVEGIHCRKANIGNSNLVTKYDASRRGVASLFVLTMHHSLQGHNRQWHIANHTWYMV